MAPLNLTKTQSGYVPLGQRFKSFPQDSENTPASDSEFYFDNFANGTLEHATLDLLYPPPEWLRERLRLQKNPGHFTLYRVTSDGKIRITSDDEYRIGFGEK